MLIDRCLQMDDEVDSYEIEGNFSLEETTYPLTLTSPLGPFTSDLASCELQELFYSVTQVTLSFTYQSVNIGTLAILPYQWDVEVVLDLVGGLADPSINIETSVIAVNGISATDITNLINFVLLVCALLSAGLSIISIAHNLAVYRRTRSRYRHLQRKSLLIASQFRQSIISVLPYLLSSILLCSLSLSHTRQSPFTSSLSLTQLRWLSWRHACYTILEPHSFVICGFADEL